MYPDRQSVERLEEDVVGQDEAQLAAPELLNAEPGAEPGTDEEQLQDFDEQE
jgi:hypothetical protein